MSNAVLVAGSFGLIFSFTQVRDLDTSDMKNPKALVRCSKSELKGNFVAPEQRWPFNQLKVFNADE